MKLEKKTWFPLMILCLVSVCIASATILIKYKSLAGDVNIFEKSSTDISNYNWKNPVDSAKLVSPVSVTGDVYLFGERVPLEDPDVRERLERELQLNTYWHSNTMMSMMLANRYFGQLETILKANQVHEDFKYLALIESGFRNDVSAAGAVGFWQIIKPTAQIYNLEVNSEVDERYNIEKSTVAACKYLTDAKSKFGNWTIAAGSYNLGMGSMAQRITDQKTNNFYDLYLNPETSRYIFRILATKIIFSNPKRAGFNIKPVDLYQPYRYKIVTIDSSIYNISDFAAQYHLKYKHIKILNTWLRDAKLTNKAKKQYEIRILEMN